MRISSMNYLAGVVLVFVLSLLPLSSVSTCAELPVVHEDGKLGSPFARVFEKAAPTVVRIEVTGTVKRETGEDPWYLRQQKKRDVRPFQGMGSGVIVDRKGHILTNNHVIEKPDKSAAAEEIRVILNDGEEYEAEVVGRDPESDLAVIRLKLGGKLLPPELVAELGDSDELKPGDYAIAIGNPLGLERTITVGVISALGRYKRIEPIGAERLSFKNFIQTDALINPGNSGGALLNIYGQVIGINDIYIVDSGIGFAIPINLAKKIMKQLIEKGVVKRGALGVAIADLTRDIQKALDLPDREGVYIRDVLEGTPAEEAGLAKGDIIVSLNGEKMKNSNEFLLRVGDLPPGETISIGVLHDGGIKKLTLTLADRDEILQAGNVVNWRGIHVVDLDNTRARKFNLGNIKKGVVILKIDSGSPAEDTTLQPGDVILEIENTPVDDLEDFERIKEEVAGDGKKSKQPILIYRMRRQSNGRLERGYVAVKGE